MLRWLFRIAVVTTLSVLGVVACVGGPEASQQLNPQPLPPKSPDDGDESQVGGDNSGAGSSGEPTSAASPDAGTPADAATDGDR